ncbi:phosphatase PAP2 family protein [Ruegeria arenilitoris]|uniref:phosphatase PAP2 family protein n=1 Tax=Ruegeria arenilitoris TaxID=1173585 RepID=UPI0020C472C4|nr:phosphatase PAP2 family protein [Ruegeria arenilitoris]
MNSADVFNQPSQANGLFSSILRNRLLLIIIALHVIGGAVISHYAGLPYWTVLGYSLIEIVGRLIKYAIVIGAIFFVFRFVYAAIWIRPAKPIQWMMQDTRKYIARNITLVDGTVCFLSIGFLITSFTCLKNIIVLINPFSWDPFFAELDRTLHGGYDVWLLLWPVFGNTTLTTVLNVAYHLWFALIYLTLFAACFDKRDTQRGMTYLVAFALVFIVGGNLLATVFASVGPVYYEHFGFGDTYAQQMQNLYDLDRISPVWALQVQERLLAEFSGGGVIKGISAMPSMHVASSVLMALFAFQYSRWLGWAFTIFAIMIQIGSVHLAWHYAVDGYLGAIIALACWWLANALTKRYYSAPALALASRAT